MKKKELKRNYKMSDAVILQAADNLKSKAQRDLAALAAFGVSETTLTELGTAREDFANTTTDQELMADMMFATQNKSMLRNSVLTKIRQIADRARIKFGEADARFRAFGVKLLTKKTDNELYYTARKVARVSTTYLAELASEGLTAPMIASLLAENDLFNNAIDLQKDAILDRDFAMQERIELGNNLYALMVNLAAKGKLCYLETDEARFNDYIIYKNKNKKPPQFETEGAVSPTSVTSTSVSGISDNTEITLKNTSDAPLLFFFTENATDISAPTMVPINPKTKLKLNAKTLGFNETKGFVRLNVFNSSNIEGDFSILWD